MIGISLLLFLKSAATPAADLALLGLLVATVATASYLIALLVSRLTLAALERALPRLRLIFSAAVTHLAPVVIVWGLLREYDWSIILM